MTDWEYKFDILCFESFYIIHEVFNHQLFFTKLCPVFGAYSVVCFKLSNKYEGLK